MQEVVILSALRTPIGSFGGSLKELSATRLGAAVIQAVIQKAGLEAEAVNEVYMGSVLQANLGQAPARQAALFAGLPHHVACTTINKVCASGLKSIAIGAQQIMLGEAEVVVAGGMESMSNVPYYTDQARWGGKFGHSQLIDGLLKDGLTDVYNGEAMGMAAELCARECKISRQHQDEFAIASYQRSQQAWSKGWFKEEVVPVTLTSKKGQSQEISKDEEPFQVNFDKIATLKPAFQKEGTVTAANASTLSDGAAAVVLMSAAKARSLGLKPLAKILAAADAEQSPQWFTTTPALALPKAVQKAGLTNKDISLWEINEAFSVVGIENIRRLNIHHDQVNIHGGAVSLGHPLGASGARILVTLLHALGQHSGKYGAAGICNGGGGASAMVIERL